MNYLEIIKNVVNNGTPKQATRYDAEGKVIPVENGTIGTFCEIFRHDMSQGFPLTTLRKMPWKSIRVELEGFIKGITDKKWFQDRGCKFWDEWANPLSVKKLLEKNFIDIDYGFGVKDRDRKVKILKEAQSKENDLGPIYGYQWRNFGGQYGEVGFEDFIEGGICLGTGQYQQIETNVNGLEGGYDQLKSIVGKLHNSPYDRRMVCSAWNPNQMHISALPPCHWGWNVVVYGNKLNLIWHQRSCDLLLGAGANIASYALLLELLAKEAGLIPGELVGTLADCHIYENHMDAAREMIQREEKELPKLKINVPQGLDLSANRTEREFSIFDWVWSDAVLTGYNPHDKIDVGAVTV
jgi:thymidylate synthase